MARRAEPAHRVAQAKPRTPAAGRAGGHRVAANVTGHAAGNIAGHGHFAIHRASYGHPGFGETDSATARSEAYGFCGQMEMPAVELTHVSRGFSRNHAGIDLMAPQGSPVRAAAAGSILYAGWYFGYGNMVDIRHADGVVTRYAHMTSIDPGMEPGALVLAGDEIGKVGSTGHATAPHVHFEVRVGGLPVDPKPFLALGSCDGDPAEPVLQEAYAGAHPATARHKQQRSRHVSR